MLMWVKSHSKILLATGALALGALIYGLSQDQPQQGQLEEVVARLKAQLEAGAGPQLFRSIMQQAFRLAQPEMRRAKLQYRQKRRQLLDDLPSYCRLVARFMVETKATSDYYMVSVLDRLGISKQQFQRGAISAGITPSSSAKGFPPSKVGLQELRKIMQLQGVILERHAGVLVRAMIEVSEQLSWQERMGLSLAVNNYCIDRLFLEEGYDEEDYMQLLRDEMLKGRNSDIYDLIAAQTFRLKQLVDLYQQRSGLANPPVGARFSVRVPEEQQQEDLYS